MLLRETYPAGDHILLPSLEMTRIRNGYTLMKNSPYPSINAVEAMNIRGLIVAVVSLMPLSMSFFC